MKQPTRNQIELIETGKIAKSLKRLTMGRMHFRSWRRALIHAMQIADVASFDQQRAIRSTLELP